MHFENFILNKRIDLASKDFTRIWALANHATCTNDAVDHQLTNNVDQNELNQERNEQELQLPQTTTQDTGESTDLLYTQHEKTSVERKTMTTWAATQSLLSSKSTRNMTCTNTEVLHCSEHSPQTMALSTQS